VAAVSEEERRKPIYVIFMCVNERERPRPSSEVMCVLKRKQKNITKTCERLYCKIAKNDEDTK